MITISYLSNSPSYEFLLTGHAGYADYGKDIVCAAVSALTCTLCDCLEKMRRKLSGRPVIEIRDGYAHISFETYRYCYEDGDMLFWTIRNGYEMIANQYPDYVQLKELDTADADLNK